MIVYKHWRCSQPDYNVINLIVTFVNVIETVQVIFPFHLGHLKPKHTVLLSCIQCNLKWGPPLLQIPNENISKNNCDAFDTTNYRVEKKHENVSIGIIDFNG